MHGFCLLFCACYATIYLYFCVVFVELNKGAFNPCLLSKLLAVAISAGGFAGHRFPHPQCSDTHGQGLSGAINGSVGGANNARLTPADQMLAKVTRIAGVVFFVVAILACLFAGRLAG